MDTLRSPYATSTLDRLGARHHIVAAALVAIALGAAVPIPAAAQTVVAAGQTIDQFDLQADLGELRMLGGTLILRLPVSTATDSTLRNGVIIAPGIGLRLELNGDTRVPGLFGSTYPENGMFITASAAELVTPLDILNKGQVFQTGSGVLTLGGGARLINEPGSTYWIENDLGMERTSVAATASFVNQGGSVIKRSGTGTSQFRVPVIQHSGKFEAWSGTIALATGGYYNFAEFYADGMGTNTSPFGITFGGSSTFTGVITTETGALRLAQQSRIKLIPTAAPSGFVAGEWLQYANFVVDAQSRVQIAPGATLKNGGNPNNALTASLIATDGALVAVGAETGAPGSLSRGRLLNDGSFQGPVLGLDPGATGPCIPSAIGLSCVIDVRNLQGAEFVFRPGPARNLPDGNPESVDNIVGIFENAGRVLMPGIVNPPPGVPARQLTADEFIQDQQGTPVIGQPAELVIDPHVRFNVGGFIQHDGDTVVNGLLQGQTVEFLGGTLSGTGTIKTDSFVTTIRTRTVTVMPGSSPGILTIDGSLEADGTTFDIEISGVVAGLEYDRLVVHGQAYPRNSILNLRFINGFVPSPGDVFEWLVADPPFMGLPPLTVNVSSDIATIGGVSDGRSFVVTSVTPVPPLFGDGFEDEPAAAVAR